MWELRCVHLRMAVEGLCNGRSVWGCIRKVDSDSSSESPLLAAPMLGVQFEPAWVLPAKCGTHQEVASGGHFEKHQAMCNKR